MTTTRKLIKGALRLVNVVGANEEPSADDMNITLRSLNGLVESMGNDLLNIYTVQPYYFPLVPGQQHYKLGPEFDSAGNPTGADWVTQRPMRIEQGRLMLYPVMTSTPVTTGTTITTGPGECSGIRMVLDAGSMTYADEYSVYYGDVAIIGAGGAIDTNFPEGITGTETSVEFPGLLDNGRNSTIKATGSLASVDITGWRAVEFHIGDCIEATGTFILGVITGGSEAPVEPAPAILSFNPNDDHAVYTLADPNIRFGGMYFAGYQSDGNIFGGYAGLVTGMPALGAGDVLGIVVDGYKPGTPVLSTEADFFVNGAYVGSMTVPYTCADGSTRPPMYPAIAATQQTFTE